MAGASATRCDSCRAQLKLKNADSYGRTLRCPHCGERFVARPVKKRRSRATSAGDLNSVLTDASKPAGLKDGATRLPGRSRRRKSTPIEEARRKRDALLLQEEKEAEARKPKEAAVAVVALLFWINAHFAAAVTLADCGLEIAALASEGAARQMRGPVVIIGLAAMAWFHIVLPRDINLRGAAAACGLFFVIVCGLVSYVAVTATNSMLGYEFFQVRWGPVYFGVSLILFAILGFGRETPVEYAERMMTQGEFGLAAEAIERELEKNPDNLRALQIQKELREMLSLV